MFWIFKVEIRKRESNPVKALAESAESTQLNRLNLNSKYVIEGTHLSQKTYCA